MKIGIIGAGAIGKKHAEAIRTSGDDVAWVIDTNDKNGNALAKEYDARFSTSPADLWADESVTAVVVGIPNWLHKSMAIDAMRAGKDVLIEKPLALNTQECQQIADVVEATQRVLQVGHVHRYTGVGKQAKQLIDAGTLGGIYYAQAMLFLRRGVPGLGRWFTNKELSGGGTLIDVGVHLIDLAMYLLDFPEVTEVSGQTFKNFGVRMADYNYEEMWSGPPDLKGKCDVEDAAQALVRFSNGAVLDLHVAWAGNYPNKFLPTSCITVCGTKSGLAFELFGNEVQLTSEVDGKVVDKSFDIPENEFFLEQFLDFKNSIDSRVVQQADCRQACLTQGIVDAIYHSSQEAKAIQNSPIPKANIAGS